MSSPCTHNTHMFGTAKAKREPQTLVLPRPAAVPHCPRPALHRRRPRGPRTRARAPALASAHPVLATAVPQLGRHLRHLAPAPAPRAPFHLPPGRQGAERVSRRRGRSAALSLPLGTRRPHHGAGSPAGPPPRPTVPTRPRPSRPPRRPRGTAFPRSARRHQGPWISLPPPPARIAQRCP